MPRLPSTETHSALHFQLKPWSHHYYFSLPSFGLFCFFSRFPNHETGGGWLAGARSCLLSQCCVCWSPSFPLFIPSNASAISLLEICLAWHYRILLYFVRRLCLHKRLLKKGLITVRSCRICPVTVFLIYLLDLGLSCISHCVIRCFTEI